MEMETVKVMVTLGKKNNYFRQLFLYHKNTNNAVVSKKNKKPQTKHGEMVGKLAGIRGIFLLMVEFSLQFGV